MSKNIEFYLPKSINSVVKNQILALAKMNFENAVVVSDIQIHVSDSGEYSVEWPQYIEIKNKNDVEQDILEEYKKKTQLTENRKKIRNILELLYSDLI